MRYKKGPATIVCGGLISGNIIIIALAKDNYHTMEHFEYSPANNSVTVKLTLFELSEKSVLLPSRTLN